MAVGIVNAALFMVSAALFLRKITSFPSELYARTIYPLALVNAKLCGTSKRPTGTVATDTDVPFGGNGKGADATPLTVVINCLLAIAVVLLLTIGAVAATPFTVVVSALPVVAAKLVVAGVGSVTGAPVTPLTVVVN